MTNRVRGLAKKISCFVVRTAAPGSKEWARATAREMEFIESDWAALRWALGSMRILLRPCADVQIKTLADVPRAAMGFAKEIHRRTMSGVFVCVLEAVCFSWFLRSIRNPTARMGCYLVVGGMIYMAFQLIARRGTLSARQDSPVSPEAYRLELERQREFHSGGWVWSRLILMIPGFMLYCLGNAIAHPARTGFFSAMAAVFLFFCVLGIPLNRSVARKYQRRMDELDGIVEG